MHTPSVNPRVTACKITGLGHNVIAHTTLLVQLQCAVTSGANCAVSSAAAYQLIACLKLSLEATGADKGGEGMHIGSNACSYLHSAHTDSQHTTHKSVDCAQTPGI